MTRTPNLLPVLVSVLVLACPAAAAESTGRFYVGAGGGYVHSIDYCGPFFDTVVLSCDNTTLGYKVYGGINLLDFLAVEAGYVDLGKLNLDAQVTGVPVSDETRARGGLLQGVVNLPITQSFSLIGKAGGIYWTLKQDFTIAGTPFSESNSGVDMVLGLGAQYQFTNRFGLRVEWEYFPNLGKAEETGDQDINFYSLSALLRF